jgi:thiosulfate/3-mercaptopyruvate sulfurtransferase
LEPHEKVLVDRQFLDTDHGDIGCVECHGGDDDAPGMEAAHAGMQADPTFPDATAVCGPCHETEAELAKTSLHYTLATYKQMLHQRTTGDPAKLSLLDKGMGNHCYGCHASCGECHVSRPNFARGGFIDGHRFNKKPDQTNQCVACHGSRVGNEFRGETGQGDVHYTKHNMDCMECHTARDLHGDGRSDHRDRYDVEGLAECRDCHEDDGEIEQHEIHGDEVSCYVCHAQPYANCFSCHVGLDKKGLAYYKNPVEEELFRIGLNPDPNPSRPEKWMLVRRVPVVPDSFEYYGDNLLDDFDTLKNWKYASPHNVQRLTHQNRKCNNCHGNKDLFLTEEKVRPKMRKANAGVIVPEGQIPEKQDAPEKETEPPRKKRSYF